MTTITKLINEILSTGYLTVELENQLRYLLQNTKYSQEDIDAYITLQEATMKGLVRQQSRELIVAA